MRKIDRAISGDFRTRQLLLKERQHVVSWCTHLTNCIRNPAHIDIEAFGSKGRPIVVWVRTNDESPVIAAASIQKSAGRAENTGGPRRTRTSNQTVMSNAALIGSGRMGSSKGPADSRLDCLHRNAPSKHRRRETDVTAALVMRWWVRIELVILPANFPVSCGTWGLPRPGPFLSRPVGDKCGQRVECTCGCSRVEIPLPAQPEPDCLCGALGQVGTTQRSIAAMASAWLCRNVRHVCDGVCLSETHTPLRPGALRHQSRNSWQEARWDSRQLTNASACEIEST